MCCMRFTMSSSYHKAVEHQLKTVQHLGNLRQVKYLLALLAVMPCTNLAKTSFPPVRKYPTVFHSEGGN